MKPYMMFLPVMLLLIMACNKSEPAKSVKPAEMKQIPLTFSQKSVISESNAFGFAFYKAMQPFAPAGQNLMVSPLSISMALGMTRNGAAGSTLDSMTGTLGYTGMADTAINGSCRYLLNTFTGLDPLVTVTIANSIWYRNTFPVLPSFVAVNRDYFSASVTPLDFTDPASVTTINDWVSGKTSHLIPQIIQSIPSEMVMYLINAVYFKGSWRSKFDKSSTLPKPFTLAGGSVIQVPAMRQQSHFNYFQTSGFQAVELPYNQGNYNMIILLPAIGSSPSLLAAQLTKEKWEQWSQNFSSSDVMLQLPKFAYEYDEVSMVRILTAMGMGIAFDNLRADFTRINAGGGLYISEVKHKTAIKTDEEGTAAAAVTSVGVGVTSTGPGSTVDFTVDRPFLYFISEKSTGTILFIGSVMNPLN